MRDFNLKDILKFKPFKKNKPVSKKGKRRLRKPIVFLLMSMVGLSVGLLGAFAYDTATKVDAVEFVVDGTPWFTVTDKQGLYHLLEVYKQSYLSSIQANAEISSVEFTQSIELVDVRVNKEEPISLDSADVQLHQIVSEATYYTVVKGDNLWNIAIDNTIPLAEIIRLNPSLNPDKIWPGDQILFVPQDPLLDVQVNLTTKVFEPMGYRTEYIQDKTLYASQRIVVKPGKEGIKNVTYDITMLNGYAQDVIVEQETQLVAPVNAVVRVGTKRTLVRISNSNFGVTTGRLSSDYGYRIHPITGVRTFHAGIDIATPVGTAVYAYTDGTVVAAGWDNSYGRYVKISHGNGLETLYLHLSSIEVSVGDKVKVGNKIAKVGNTGFSTGPHLHFEVRVNGASKSPWAYI